jgi:ATP-dependent DNA helicase 2 subunit 2
MIAEGTKNARGELLKYTRKIYVVTDGRGYLDTTGLEGIVSKLKKTEIKITLL